MAEGVVCGDVVELLAVILDQRGGDGVRLHLRGVADAEHVPVAACAGDRIGMAAGADVENVLFVRNLGHGERQRGVHVAQQKVDLVVVDQFARLLHRNSGVAAGRIFDDELGRTAEQAALGVDLVESHLAADQFVLAQPRVGARQRIVEFDLDDLSGARGDDERRSNLCASERQSRLDHPATADPARTGVDHLLLPNCNRRLQPISSVHASADALSGGGLMDAQVGQVILQPLSSTVPATSAPLTTLVTLNRSSGAEPLACASPTKSEARSWFWPAR